MFFSPVYIMKTFHFVCISNNNNATDFHIEATSMKNPRLRISSLKSQHKRSKIAGDTLSTKPIFRFFELNFSFFILNSVELEENEVTHHIAYLTEIRNEKMKTIVPENRRDGVLTFDCNVT